MVRTSGATYWLSVRGHRQAQQDRTPAVRRRPSRIADGRPGRRLWFVVLTAALVAAGCGGPDRAGGDAAEQTVVLTFAQPNEGLPAPLEMWADEVTKASGGSLQIQFQDGWRLGEPDYEYLTIGDVRAGKVDMGWVGARAFDRAGVTSFQALLAPMLIDSNDLQQQVFDAGIPQEMMAGLDPLDVVGVGVLPGPLRTMLGVDRAFTAPSDFAGTTIGIQDSALTAMTFDAVGATTEKLPSSADISGVDGYEVQLSAIWSNGYADVAKTVTGNLNLWPRPLVIFIGTPVYDRLSESQRAALTGAADLVTATAIAASRDDERDALAHLCDAGMTLTTADLPAFAAAFQPVYDTLRTDPHSRDWLDRITELKATAALPAATATCADAVAGTATDTSGDAAGTGLAEGTYQAVVTPADYDTFCKPGDPGAQNVISIKDATQTLQFDVEGDQIIQYQLRADGARERGWIGSYSIFRDTFTLRVNGSRDDLVTTFTLADGVLTLTDMQTDRCDDRLIWTSEPWTKIR